jgi:hypothetical protein
VTSTQIKNKSGLPLLAKASVKAATSAKSIQSINTLDLYVHLKTAVSVSSLHVFRFDQHETGGHK